MMAADMTDRPVWFPGNAAPPHLDGSLPGDFGCAVSSVRHRLPSPSAVCCSVLAGGWTQECTHAVVHAP